MEVSYGNEARQQTSEGDQEPLQAHSQRQETGFRAPSLNEYASRMPNDRRRPLEANNPISRRRRATMRHAQKTRGKMTARDRQMALRRAQRKYLRGAIIDTENRAATEQRMDGLPDSAFAGERVRSFVAVSSWFWYCYRCAQPGDDSNESQAR
jgi:hypothetical protein